MTVTVASRERACGLVVVGLVGKLVGDGVIVVVIAGTVFEVPAIVVAVAVSEGLLHSNPNPQPVVGAEVVVVVVVAFMEWN